MNVSYNFTIKKELPLAYSRLAGVVKIYPLSSSLFHDRRFPIFCGRGMLRPTLCALSPVCKEVYSSQQEKIMRYLKFLFSLIRGCWKVIHTSLTVLATFFFLGVLALFFIGLSHKAPEVAVPEGAALLVNPHGNVVEKQPALRLFGRELNKLAGFPLEDEDVILQDLLDTINAAAGDPHIKLLVLDLDRLGNISLDQIRSIGKSLELVKEQGKLVIAVGDSFNQSQYYLASWADQIYLNPMGGVDLHGFSVVKLYLKEMLDKLAVNIHIFRVGSYKAAVEPLIRNDMSPEDRTANLFWLEKLWQLYCTDIAKNRKMSVEDLQNKITGQAKLLTMADGNTATFALNAKLVDALKSRPEMLEAMRKIVGSAKNSTDINAIQFDQYLTTLTPTYTDAKEKKPLIGIIYASGNIVYGKGDDNQIGADTLIEQIKRARQDSHIKALVLRLDTGGGSAFASELIRQEIVLTQKKGKPVVVSMGAVTASGGYWLAANANHLVAAPSTLTGSIGIFGAAPTLEKTLANMGIHSDGVTVGKGTLPPGFTRGMSPEDEASFQLSVENGYKRFLEIVAQGRGKKVSNVEAIAQGRVWDGATALQLGLVDSLGDLHDAVKVAARLAKVPAENAVFIRAPANTFFEQMVEQKLPWESQLVSKWLSFASFSAATLAVHDHLTSQYSFLFEQADPNGLYAHSFLPDPGEIAH